MGKIVSLENVMLLKQLFPPEQFAALSRPTKYHEDLEAQFYLMRDQDRFCLGWAWFCCKCNEEAATIEAYAPESKQWLLVKASCRVCGSSFLHPGCYRFGADEMAELDEEAANWIILMRACAYWAMTCGMEE